MQQNTTVKTYQESKPKNKQHFTTVKTLEQSNNINNNNNSNELYIIFPKNF